jgi:hypothetical protein
LVWVLGAAFSRRVPRLLCFFYYGIVVGGGTGTVPWKQFLVTRHRPRQRMEPAKAAATASVDVRDAVCTNTIRSSGLQPGSRRRTASRARLSTAR